MTGLDLRWNALKKTKELLRDLLYIKYGEEWRKHDRLAGKFYENPDAERLALMTFLLAFADGEPSVIGAVMAFGANHNEVK